MKKYIKPTVKIVEMESTNSILHSSNWYDRQNHGHQHHNHDDDNDNGNHYGKDNGNGWDNFGNGWD